MERFRQAVLQGARVLYEECPDAVEMAIRHYTATGNTRDREDLRSCIQLAGEIQELMASLKTGETSTQQAMDPAYDIEIMRERILAHYEPIVQRVRQRIFGSASPPFSSYDAAVTWLEAADKTQQRPVAATAEQLRQLYEEILERIIAYYRLTSRWISLRTLPGKGTIPYMKYSATTPAVQGEYYEIPAFSHTPQATPYITPMPDDTPLALIEKFATGMAGGEEKMSGFSKLSCVAWCLAGIPPTRPWARFSVDRTGLWFEMTRSRSVSRSPGPPSRSTPRMSRGGNFVTCPGSSGNDGLFPKGDG